MTLFPLYLSEYPNMHSAFPFHLAIHNIKNFPAHRHDYLEFSLVLEGNGTEIINGVEYPIVPGTFTFISPYQIHEIHANQQEPLKLFNCIIGLELIMEREKSEGELIQLLFNESEERETTSILLEPEAFEQVKSLLITMHKEYLGHDIWRNAMIKAHLTQILILFDRIRHSKSQKSQHPMPKKNRSMIWPVVHYIHTHYHENITLTHLSKIFNVSVPYLSEQFKKHMGENFVGFLHEVRIRHAASLLLSTDMSVSDIALEVGYQSFKTFSRVFRDHKKVTPTAFRKAQSI